MLVDQAIPIHRPSKLRDEDEIHGFGPLFWINDRVLCLALFQVFQLRKDPILQPDDSPTSCAFRLAVFPLSCRPFSQCSFNTDRSTFPVNVLPLESNLL